MIYFFAGILVNVHEINFLFEFSYKPVQDQGILTSYLCNNRAVLALAFVFGIDFYFGMSVSGSTLSTVSFFAEINFLFRRS